MYGALAASAIGAGMSAYQNWSQTAGPLAKSSSKLDVSQARKLMDWQNYYQKRYDTWKSDLDYRYAQQYAQNSAQWNVQGLLNAGLNPILAANNGNFNSTFGQPVSGGGVSASSRSRGSRQDMAQAAASMAATARQNALIDEQIKQAKAQTANIEQDTANKKATQGLSGTPAAVSVLANKLGLSDGNVANKIRRLADGSPLVEVEKAADRHDANSAHSARTGGISGLLSKIGEAFYFSHKHRQIMNEHERLMAKKQERIDSLYRQQRNLHYIKRHNGY